MTPTLQRLTARGRALVQRFKPQSASVRNVLKLAGGTAGSQVITVAAAPILTRLYGPESFGVLATFASILALLNVVSSLRYELAIVVSEDDDEAIALVWLCFVLVAISTALTALGVALLGNQLVGWLHQPALKPLLWLLPVGVLLTGMYQPLSYWAIRRKQFGLLAQTKFRQSIFGVATNLAAAPLGTIGLLLGQIVSQSAGLIAIWSKSKTQLWHEQKVNLPYLRKIFKRYKHFALYSSPSGIINVIGAQAPVLLFATAFGIREIGLLSLSQRLLTIPASLIGSTIGHVFLAKGAEAHKLKELSRLTTKTSRFLFRISIALSILIVFALVPLIPLLFGEKWAEMRWTILAIIPIFIGQLTVSPLSNVFAITEKNRTGLLGQIILFVARISPLAMIGFAPSFMITLVSYSLLSALGYAIYLALIYQSFKSDYP